MIFHVWSNYKSFGHDLRRHILASKSWHLEYSTGHWTPLPIESNELKRTSKSVLGDRRTLPFVRDILDKAIQRVGSSSDMICFTNFDVVFAPGLTDTLLGVKQVAWASRMEFVRLPKLPSCLEIICARKHVGSDLFLFLPNWWRVHRNEFPDMVIANEAWDLIMRKLMMLYGGTEILAAIAHEEHISEWLTHRSDPAAIHNRNLAGDWLAKRNLPWL